MISTLVKVSWFCENHLTVPGKTAQALMWVQLMILSTERYNF